MSALWRAWTLSIGCYRNPKWLLQHCQQVSAWASASVATLIYLCWWLCVLQASQLSSSILSQDTLLQCRVCVWGCMQTTGSEWVPGPGGCWPLRMLPASVSSSRSLLPALRFALSFCHNLRQAQKETKVILRMVPLDKQENHIKSCGTDGVPKEVICPGLRNKSSTGSHVKVGMNISSWSFSQNYLFVLQLHFGYPAEI